MATYAGPDSELRPNADAIRQFTDWWFKHCTRGCIEIGWLDPAGRGLIHFLQFDLDNRQELVAAAVTENLTPGQSIYVRASTVRQGTGGRTTDADFTQSPGCWGDLDTPEQVEKARSVQSIVRPNGRVITGQIPHLRAQNFFRANEPIVSPEMVRRLNSGILRLYGGDAAVVNPTRLMRLPGTIAWPWKAQRVPELTSFALPQDDRPLSYPLATLTSQLPLDDAPAPQPPAPPAGTRATLNLVSEYMRQIRAGQHWHDNMVRLVAHWIGKGWCNAEILAAAESFTLPGYTAAQTQAEVAKAIEGGRKRWNVPDQEPTLTAEPVSPFPDQVIDPWDTLQPTEFPVHVLPGVLRDFAETRSRVVGADVGALAWAGISACSAALGGGVRVKIKKHDTWSVPTNIWVALIGPSSSKKTPVINEAWDGLSELQSVALRAYAAATKQWQSLPKEERKSAPEPQSPIRLITHNATMEALQGILSKQDRGIGVLADELAGLICNMDRYAAQGGGERAFWLQSYNGGPYVTDRVGRGTVAIDNLLTTVCGGIQPDRLAQFKDLTDDGLWQRMVPYIMARSALGTDESPGPERQAYAERLKGLVDAASMGGGRVLMELSGAAHEVRAALEVWLFELAENEPLGPRFASFVGKMPGLFGRLCAVLSALEPSGFVHIISERVARDAAFLIKHSVIPHAARVYLTMGDGEASAEAMQAIAGFILVKKTSRVLVSDLTTGVWQCRKRSLADVTKILAPLVAGGWLNPETETPGNRAWLVNPLVHTRFGDRAASETARRAVRSALIRGGQEEENAN